MITKENAISAPAYAKKPGDKNSFSNSRICPTESSCGPKDNYKVRKGPF
jgi:hypothetical protein